MSDENPKTTAENAVEKVIANARRLIDDACLLFESGRFPSALTTAILAFEEIGKSKSLAIGAKKTKFTPSWHQFRQSIAATWLTASLFQKYGMSDLALPDDVVKTLKEKRSEHKRLSDFASEPIPSAALEKIIAAIDQQLPNLTADEQHRFGIEISWLNKVMMAAYTGDLENLRQKAIYVDTVNDELVSSPDTISEEQAYTWIVVAQRSLVLAEQGDFKRAYSPLAEFVEAHGINMEDKLQELVEILNTYAGRTNEQSPTGPETT